MTPDEEQAAEFRRRVDARRRWRLRQAATLPSSPAFGRQLAEAWAPYRAWQIERHLPADDPWEDL